MSCEKLFTCGEVEQTVEWSAEEEIKLFLALEGLKPVGVNKHFYMACIVERLSKSLNRDVPAKAVWARLHTLYNLEMLDLLEPLPFPNEQKDFTLPTKDFYPLLSKNRTENAENHLNLVIEASSINISKTQLPPPSIIAVITDNTTKGDKRLLTKSPVTQIRELEKKISTKLEAPKRTPKRTRGSMSLESSSPSTTPPPVHNQKRRRI